ncbi:hypothetical protein KIL84_022314 [Mauremys mutica]|uniref:Uncharacterized protein n=1 Tax=Mauremys mutica TaxID=74926 RepID=A0A9D3X8G4_9SAUR|nr:hypothetical protein KIL84_022314 [Mauremys mutica]
MVLPSTVLTALGAASGLEDKQGDKRLKQRRLRCVGVKGALYKSSFSLSLPLFRWHLTDPERRESQHCPVLPERQRQGYWSGHIPPPGLYMGQLEQDEQCQTWGWGPASAGSKGHWKNGAHSSLGMKGSPVLTLHKIETTCSLH